MKGVKVDEKTRKKSGRHLWTSVWDKCLSKQLVIMAIIGSSVFIISSYGIDYIKQSNKLMLPNVQKKVLTHLTYISAILIGKDGDTTT